MKINKDLILTKVSLKESFFKYKNRPNVNKAKPWPISPNITPNKNGNVTIVNIPGFISLYFGIE